MTTDDLLKKSVNEPEISESMKKFLTVVWETNNFRLAAKEVGWAVSKAPHFFEQGMALVRKKHGLQKNANKSPKQWIKLIEKA